MRIMTRDLLHLLMIPNLLDSAKCISYGMDYYQRNTLESYFNNLEQTPLNRCQQVPALYKWPIDDNDNDDDFRSGCRNVSQHHHKQSFSRLHSPRPSYFTDLWNWFC